MTTDEVAHTPSELLRVSGLTCEFGGLRAVDGADLEVHQGTVIGLVGPNGAGKTSLLNAVHGLIRPDAGQVLLEGHNVTTLPPYRRVQMGMARAFQTIRLCHGLSVLDNVKLGLHVEQRTGMLSACLYLPRRRREEREAIERAMEALRTFSVDHLARRPAGQLSFGEQRRTELARSIVRRPRLLLLDEPTSGVDAAEVARLASVILQLKAAGQTILVVEHNLVFVRQVCDEVAVMNAGRVFARGPVEATLGRQDVIDAYLGGELA